MYIEHPVTNDPKIQQVNKNLPVMAVRRARTGIFMIACVLVFSMLVRSAMAANNVVMDMVSQTGSSPGSSLTPTWTLAANSLIAGQSPSGTNGDFNLEPYWGDRNVNSLTAGGSLTIAAGGSPTTTSINYVTCGDNSGAGSLVVYTLTGSANGYNLTNITVYGGWRDAGRDQQGYTVYYSTVAAPSTFISLGSVYYNPANAAGVACATRVTLTSTNGALATGVAAVKFDFTTPTTPNGWCGYSQIQVFGKPTGTPPTANLPTCLPGSPVNAGTLVTFNETASGVQPLQYQWQSDNGSGGVSYTDIAGATGTNYILNTTNFGNFTINFPRAGFQCQRLHV